MPNKTTSTIYKRKINQHQDIDNIRKNIKLLQKSPSFNADKSMATNLLNSINDDSFPTSDTPNHKTNNVLYTVIDSSPKELSIVHYLDRKSVV